MRPIFLPGTAACLGVPITTRVISLIARRIVSDLGSYYAVLSIRLILLPKC